MKSPPRRRKSRFDKETAVVFRVPRFNPRPFSIPDEQTVTLPRWLCHTRCAMLLPLDWMTMIPCKVLLIAAGGLAFLRRMRRKLLLASIFCLGACSGQGADLSIVSFDRNHNLSWNNVFSNAITTVETATSPTGPWRALKSFYDQGKSDKASLPPMAGNHFVRLLQADISATPEGFTSLVTAYGLLSTLAGNAGGTGVDGVNEWLPEFEGAYATDVILSRPHIAMADHAGNIFIADKDSHSILEITLDGRIHTVAGTHESGSNGDGPAPATSLQLSQPNGLDVHADGSFHILDSGNNKVRRVDTNGIMTTLFSVSTAFPTGRGIYVKKDESVAYVCATTNVMKWTPTNGVTVLKAGFEDLGNLDAGITPTSWAASLSPVDVQPQYEHHPWSSPGPSMLTRSRCSFFVFTTLFFFRNRFLNFDQ